VVQHNRYFSIPEVVTLDLAAQLGNCIPAKMDIYASEVLNSGLVEDGG
jgi:hypothetical protein